MVELDALKLERSQLFLKNQGLLDTSQVLHPIFERMDDRLGALREIWQSVARFSLTDLVDCLPSLALGVVGFRRFSGEILCLEYLQVSLSKCRNVAES